MQGQILFGVKFEISTLTLKLGLQENQKSNYLYIKDHINPSHL